jgi:hypothetical protein
MTGIAKVERFGTLLVLLIAAGFFGHALAQDVGQEQEPPVQDAPAEAAPASDDGDEKTGEADAADGAADAESEAAGDPGIDPAFDPDVYDPELDDQTYEGNDDVFVPTEEIPADEPIPFPSDI